MGPRKRATAQISLQVGVTQKKPKYEPKKEIIPGRSEIKLGARMLGVSYAYVVRGIQQVILSKVVPERIFVHKEQGDYITGANMMIVCLSKISRIETKKLLCLLT